MLWKGIKGSFSSLLKSSILGCSGVSKNLQNIDLEFKECMRPIAALVTCLAGPKLGRTNAKLTATASSISAAIKILRNPRNLDRRHVSP